MKSLLTQKIGMTRVISESGQFVPVTVLQVPTNSVLQVKTPEKDGYSAAVVGVLPRAKKSIKNVGNRFRLIREFRLEGGEIEKGAEISVADFADVKKVKITGTSKGRGFAGVIKRHNFQRGRETHGSTHHREPGSVGMCAKPGRILKGKKLPGHYGAERVSRRRVEVVSVDAENNLILIKGAVPGAPKGFVLVSAEV